MLRISRSMFTVLAIAALALGATYAYLTDTETLAENTLAAGTLDLKVDGEDNPTSSINVYDLAPGETREFTWTLRNDGSVTGIPSITFGDIDNYENDITEPESNIDDTPETGEIGDRARIRMAWNQGGSWKTIRLTNESGNAKLNDVANATFGLGLLTGGGNDFAIPHLAQGEEVTIRLTVILPNTVGNIIQSDSAIFDMTFNLTQS